MYLNALDRYNSLDAVLAQKLIIICSLASFKSTAEQNVFCSVYLKLDIREILQRIEMLLILQFVDKSMLHY